MTSTGPLFDFQLLGQRFRERDRSDAEIAIHDVAALANLFVYLLCQIAGNRKADSLIRRTDDGGVDANDLADHVDQRPAAVAGVYGGVGLQILLVR